MAQKIEGVKDLAGLLGDFFSKSFKENTLIGEFLNDRVLFVRLIPTAC